MNLHAFIKKHNLTENYSASAQQWFLPVIEQIMSFQKFLKRPIVVGINGPQGSGKSTLGDLFSYAMKRYYDAETSVLSIDDFYLSQDERKVLADEIHPLLQTRGVPGTHDIDSAISTLSSLKDFSTPVVIPRFDKSQDDRMPEDQWTLINKQLDVIVLEGWCLGAIAQSDDELIEPINNIETNEDTQMVWRNYVNHQLKQTYPSLFSQVDVWIMLKAPSFDCVLDWRVEQEDKLEHALQLQGKPISGLMSRNEVSRFIQHYQRITQHMSKTLPDKVNYLYELGKQREIVSLTYPIVL